MTRLNWYDMAHADDKSYTTLFNLVEEHLRKEKTRHGKTQFWHDAKRRNYSATPGLVYGDETFDVHEVDGNLFTENGVGLFAGRSGGPSKPKDACNAFWHTGKCSKSPKCSYKHYHSPNRKCRSYSPNHKKSPRAGSKGSNGSSYTSSNGHRYTPRGSRFSPRRSSPRRSPSPGKRNGSRDSSRDRRT